MRGIFSLNPSRRKTVSGITKNHQKIFYGIAIAAAAVAVGDFRFAGAS
jgi:hypothetical protein